MSLLLMRAATFVILACATAGTVDKGQATLPADDIEPIDFETARAEAVRAMHDGGTIDEAMSAATRVLNGESPFLPVAGLGDRSWLQADEWISAGDAALLQHEIVTSEGWSDAHLQLHSPLPAWASTLAEKLTPALGGLPDCCEVHACEPEQRTRELSLGEGTAALLTLSTPAALHATGHTSGQAVALTPRSVLLLNRRTGSPGCYVQAGRGRHLSIVLCRSASSKGV